MIGLVVVLLIIVLLILIGYVSQKIRNTLGSYHSRSAITASFLCEGLMIVGIIFILIFAGYGLYLLGNPILEHL